MNRYMLISKPRRLPLEKRVPLTFILKSASTKRSVQFRLELAEIFRLLDYIIVLIIQMKLIGKNIFLVQ